MTRRPSVVVIMGVAGSGKSAVGREVAARLGWDFVDADDLHPQANVEKMRSGLPLDDRDRAPWLAELNQLLRSTAGNGRPVVLACSALKNEYRKTLADGVAGVVFVFLRVSEGTATRRVRDRRGHFAPAGLVESQFTALEIPAEDEAIVVDADAPLDRVVASVVAALR